MGKYYLYRYVRLDTNVVFYVGIGTKHSSYIVNILKNKINPKKNPINIKYYGIK